MLYVNTFYRLYNIPNSSNLSTLSLSDETSPISWEEINSSIEHSDFEAALRVIKPSTKKEGFVTVPTVTWDNVGSLQDIRKELKTTILVSIDTDIGISLFDI